MGSSTDLNTQHGWREARVCSVEILSKHSKEGN